jgi:hypothetical protein
MAKAKAATKKTATKAPAAKAKAKKAPVKVAKAAAPKAVAKAAAKPAADADGWIDAGKGYRVTLENGKLVAKNPKGAKLSSVPKEVRDGDAAEQLLALKDWLVVHERECVENVDTWMLRSLPVPRRVLEAVWDDPAWRKPLENAVVMAVGSSGEPDTDAVGLFKGVDAKRGVGVVDLDGETVWLDTDRVAIPHPILLAELDAWRELATELSATQGVSQLFRETHAKPGDLEPGTTQVTQFADGKFAMLMHALGKCRTLGYRVRGGFAVCAVWEGGEVVEGRYWIGAEDPESETYTGGLAWVDARERALKLEQVGPVAYSEGMRMASSIYAARVVEKPAEETP